MPAAPAKCRQDRKLPADADLCGRASVRVQLPLAMGADSEPEPDIALVAVGAYRDHHPERGVYARVTPYRRGQTLTPSSFPDVSLAVDDLLG